MSSTLTDFLPNDLFVIIGKLVLLVILYYVYQAVCWYRQILVIGRVVDQLPGDKQHWLFGTLAKVTL